MLAAIVKVLLTSVLVVAIAEIAKRSSLIGAMLASLPLTSLLAIIWLYADTKDVDRVADLASGILWLVLPSLVFFLALPLLLRHGAGFAPSLVLSVMLTGASYAAMLAILRRFGFEP